MGVAQGGHCQNNSALGGTERWLASLHDQSESVLVLHASPEIISLAVTLYRCFPPGDRRTLPVKHFDLPKFRHNNFGLLSFPSHFLILPIAGQVYPSWWTTFRGLLHRRVTFFFIA